MSVPNLENGVTTESQHLDFKSVYWSNSPKKSGTWQYELAKDIGALANSFGGCLVVGAAEKDEVLTKFIDPKLPRKWEATFQKVVATWLVPEPVVTVDRHKFDACAPKQLVIEVEPSLQPVVVRNPSDGKKRLSIPMRRGTQTIYAPPQEAIRMLNNPYWYVSR